MRLIVTGTGRSGTLWAAEALSAAGIDCGHERAFDPRRHGEGDWVADSSWLAAPCTPFADAYVVHLVRHPLDVIRSRATWGTFQRRRGPWARWAIRHVPAMADPTLSPVERAAVHWTGWVQLITADETLRLEGVTAADIGRLARLVDSAAVTPALPAPNHAAARRGRALSWADVGHIPGLLEQAERFGYR